MKAAHQRFVNALAEYFYHRLTSMARVMRPAPQEETLWYVGSTMARLGDSNQLFSHDENGLVIRPLAKLYQDAHESDKHWERCLILRQLGDQALFLGALFPQKWERRGIRQDYFVGMGGAAYGYLSDHAQSHQAVFAELAATFSRWLKILADICFGERSEEGADVLTLYQEWKQTGNHELAERLRAFGVVCEDEQEHRSKH